eukprot:TRINITY_DN14784_c0_g1_i1.p1 TRINITY_DN14784_c0_g1~~TRINITY_DN14784_c0_g1_i1.p1  ORF type:complete len:340 (-),score=101.39 TRINITY_DN14784_c0_g1_i1:73-1092(-)
MSHSSGIGVSEQLSKVWGSALQNENVRLIKVRIIDDALVDVASVPIGSTDADQDFSKATDLLEPVEPCFILYRLDSKNEYGFQWVMMCYVPDKSKVKDKMTYAATRANMKRQLGSNYFINEVFGTVVKDFSKDGYDKHVESQHADAPLTQQEQLAQEEANSAVYVGGGAYVHGVAFPVDQAVIDAFGKMKSGSVNYIQLSIDAANEKIMLAEKTSVNAIEDLRGHVSTTEPRFHLYNWTHNVDGSSETSLVFIYSCPDGANGTKSAPVKLRMLYSSSKANAQNIVTNSGLVIAAKLEINAPVDVVEDHVYKMLHPEVQQQKQAFSKPTKPGKGQRRLIK